MAQKPKAKPAKVKKAKAKPTKPTPAKVKDPCAEPRAHAVHADPKTAEIAKGKPLPINLSGVPQDEKSPAEWAYERLVIYIQNFEEQLDAEHEIAVGFVGGDAGVLRIEGLGFFDPDIVTFYGSDGDGTKTQLIQHVTQLSVMLRAIPRKNTQIEANRIGFRLVADLESE